MITLRLLLLVVLVNLFSFEKVNNIVDFELFVGLWQISSHVDTVIDMFFLFYYSSIIYINYSIFGSIITLLYILYSIYT